MERMHGGTWQQSWASPNGNLLVTSRVNAMLACAEKHMSSSLNSFLVAFRRIYLTFLPGFHSSASPSLEDFLKYTIVWGGTVSVLTCVSTCNVAVHLSHIVLTTWLWLPERWREFALLSSLNLKKNCGFEVKLSKNLPKEWCKRGLKFSHLREEFWENTWLDKMQKISTNCPRQEMHIQHNRELSSTSPWRKGG